MPDPEIAGLAAAINKLNNRLESSEQKGDAPKTWTRSELSALVADGKLDQDKADEIMDAQITRAAEDIAREAAASAVQADKIGSESTAVIDRYTAANPDLKVNGSAVRTQVEKAFKELVEMGMPKDSIATEQLALERALGPVAAYEQARAGQSGGAGDADHSESVGSGKTDNEGAASEAGDAGTPPSYLTEDEKNYYDDQIRKGYIADWAAVHEEMQYASQRVRVKHGATKPVTPLKKKAA